MQNKIILILLLLVVFLPVICFSDTGTIDEKSHPVEQLVGESLTYDVSFLWFKHLAEGNIRLERGEVSGTYVAVMEARTLGFAAFITRQRIEKYQTVMEIGPDGILRPLVHSSHTFKGKGDKQREKRTSYRFDYADRTVHYRKIKDQRVTDDESLPLETDGPVFDILSAYFNLRLGAFGPLDQQALHLPTFHRKGVEEIVIAPLNQVSSGDRTFFGSSGQQCKVLVDPSVFKTKGRELLISLDQQNRLVRGIIKNVIGLGDVKGILRQ